MLLSDLIKEAQKALEKHGDICVVVWREDWGEYMAIDGTEVTEFVITPGGEDSYQFVLYGDEF